MVFIKTTMIPMLIFKKGRGD
jgi:hypothetical protein